jgi:hypothetical protein
MSTPAYKPESPAFMAGVADMDSANSGTGTVPKVPAFSQMDDEAKTAHVAEMHHPGTTVDANRHFISHITGIVPPPGHIHMKRIN